MAALPEPAPYPIAPRRSLVRNVAVLLSSQVVTWGLTMLWTVFVPRALGPADMGALTLATSVSTILGAIAGLGIQNLMVREIAQDHHRAGRLVGAALIGRLVLLPPCVLAVVMYTTLTHTGPQVTVVIWLTTAGMLLGLFGAPFLNALQALERMQYLAYSDVLSKAVVAAGGVALVLAGLGLIPLAVLALVMSVVTFALSWWWGARHIKLDLRVGWVEVRRLAVASLPYWSTSLLLTFYMWIDSLMLASMTPIRVVGWYGVGTKLFGSLLFLPVILSTAYLPRLSRAFSAGRERLVAEGRPALELTVIMSLPVAAGVAVVAPTLVWDLYGPAYVPSVRVLVILAGSIPPTYLNVMANQVLVAANRQLDWTKVMAGAAIFNPLLNLFLIRYAQGHWHNGALGAALALLATELAMLGAALWLMPRMFSWSTLGRLGRALAATALMALAVELVARRFGLVAQVGTGVLTFAVLAVGFRLLTPQMRAEGRRLIGDAGRRLRPGVRR